MSLPTVGALTPLPVAERPDLLADPVRSALAGWPPASQVGLVEIEESLADTAAMAAAYDVPMEAAANCVVVVGRRSGNERIAACVVRADMRADVNSVVKRLLDVRKASFLQMNRAVEEAGMEYGGITPVGLPEAWRLLISAEAVDITTAVIGSGIRRSKLLLPGSLLSALPRAEVIDDLAFS